MAKALKIKPLLLSAVSSAVLIAGVASLTPAQAQKGKVLEPVSRWSVSSVEGNKAGGRPYCAMARRYKGDLILTVAQNQAYEASLALDFQTPSFKKQQVFSVSLDPGNGQLREFETQPASSRAFVIRLGSDKPFFDALRKTGFLRVGIGDKIYHFDIRDIDVGKTEIDSCVAALETSPVYGMQDTTSFAQIAPASGAEAVPVPSVESATDPETKLQDLKKSIDQLREEKFRLEKTLEREREYYTSQKTEAGEPVETQISQSKDELALSNEIALLEKENERLLDKIAEMTTMVASAAGGEQAPDNEEALMLKRENETLLKVLQKRENEMKKAETDLATLEKLKVENAKLKEIVGTGDNAPMNLTSLQSEMDALRDRNTVLLRQIENVRLEVAEEYKERLAEQNRENEALKLALGQSMDSSDGAESSDPVLSMQKGIMMLEKEKEDLHAEVEALMAANKAMKVEIEGVRQTEAQLEDMKIRNKELESQIAASLSASEGYIVAQESEMTAEFESKILALESINEELHVALNQAQQKTEEIEKQTMSQKAVLDTLKSENKELRQQLAQAQSGGDNAGRIAELVSQNNELKSSVKSLQSELQEMRAEMARVQKFVELPEKSEKTELVSRASETKIPAEVAGSKVSEPSADDLIMAEGKASDIKTEVVKQVERSAPKAPPTPSPKVSPGSYANQAQRYEAELASSIDEQDGLAVPLPKRPEAIPLISEISERDVEIAKMDDVEVFGTKEGKRSKQTKVPELHVPSKAESADQKMERELKQKLAANDMARNFDPSISIQKLLNDSHVAIGEQVEEIDNRKSQGRLAYRWQAGGIFGSAELKPINAPSQFETYVYDYLNITEKRCDGEFAIIPERSLQSGSLRIDSYEIACIGGSVDSSASLLFFSKNNTFSVLAQEASMEQMPGVMDARDRIVRTLKNRSS